MRTIKAEAYWANTLEYEVRGKKYDVTGEFYLNKAKNRLEHTHIGKKGGEYLIIWKLS